MRVYACTQKGINKTQSEDSVLIGQEIFSETGCVRDLQNGTIVVADGVGGNFGGAFASNFVCRLFSDTVNFSNDEYSAVNKALISVGRTFDRYKDMATTVTGIHFNSNGSAFCFHVGNTRLYAIQASKYLKQLSQDDTVVEYLIKTGKMTEEESKTFSAKNEITACFGGGRESLLAIKQFAVDSAHTRQFLMTCDGIHDILSTDEIEKIIASCEGDWQRVVNTTVQVAKNHGSADDCTAVIIDCDENSAPTEVQN